MLLFNFSSLLGLIQVLGSLGYFVISIAQLAKPGKSRKKIELIFRIFQLIFIPLMLLLSGIIILFQGWRLDPALLFQDFLMMIIVSYFVCLDIIRYLSSR